jgi:hypothetical protein
VEEKYKKKQSLLKMILCFRMDYIIELRNIKMLSLSGRLKYADYFSTKNVKKYQSYILINLKVLNIL